LARQFFLLTLDILKLPVSNLKNFNTVRFWRHWTTFVLTKSSSLVTFVSSKRYFKTQTLGFSSRLCYQSSAKKPLICWIP